MRASRVGEPLPELRVLIYSRAAFDTPERAAEMVAYLTGHPHLAATHFGPYEPYRRLTPKRLAQAVDLVENRPGQTHNPERVSSMVYFPRSRRPECAYSVEWSHLPHVAFNTSSYTIEEDYLRSPAGLAEWLDFCFGLIRLHQAWYAQFSLNAQWLARNFMLRRVREPYAADPEWGVTTASGVGARLEEGIPGVYWGNYFGPFYVDWFGRDRFESLPCTDMRWLDTGGVFFTTAPTPFDWQTPAAEEARTAVLRHLGEDAFFDFDWVHDLVRAFEPIPPHMAPEMFQPPRRLPDFPFQIEPPGYRTIPEEIAGTRTHFEGQGYALIEQTDERTLLFRSPDGGRLRITVGPGGSVESMPRL